MYRRRFFVLMTLVIFLFFGVKDVHAQSWRISAPIGYPKFFSSDTNFDLLLNDLFYRHLTAMCGPNVWTCGAATMWRDWIGLITYWFDTADRRSTGGGDNRVLSNIWNYINATCNTPGHPCEPFDYNEREHLNLADPSFSVKIEPSGYVWAEWRVKRGWGFPIDSECDVNNQPTGCLDKRFPTNNTGFIMGVYRYFMWTRDINFLKLKNNLDNLMTIERARKAMHFLNTDLNGNSRGLIHNPWKNHEGLGWKDGVGRSLASNYWDITPFGGDDGYATIHWFDALNAMADLEGAIEENPSWGIGPNPYGESAAFFRNKVEGVKNLFQSFFWWDGIQATTKDYTKGRFFGAIDTEGIIHDYGFTYLNLEAIVKGLASQQEGETIFHWLNGESSNQFAGDTVHSKADIYHYVFAPRVTTKENKTWWSMGWDIRHPAAAWDVEVQNGGAVLYVSFYDILARIKVLGPDNAFTRLNEILNWYRQVQDEGGYRAYYGSRHIPMQGCIDGNVGVLGIDCEWLESTLVPLSFFYGFLGVDIKSDGLHIKPNLPSSLSYGGVQNVFYNGKTIKITATRVGSPHVTVVGTNKYEVTALNGQESVITPNMDLHPLGQTPTPTPVPPTPTPTSVPRTPTPTPIKLTGDINNDCTVNVLDYGLLFEQFGKNPLTDVRADLNHDGVVNILDYVILFENFGRSC